MSASLIARLAAAFSILFAATAQATIFRINENGVILAQSQADFLAGANTGILGQIDRYGNDAGFFYDPITDRYFRINENGVILAQSYADFLAGANTGILGQIDRYGNDAGFFYDPIADLYYHVNENGVIFAQSFADFLAGRQAKHDNRLLMVGARRFRRKGRSRDDGNLTVAGNGPRIEQLIVADKLGNLPHQLEANWVKVDEPSVRQQR